MASNNNNQINNLAKIKELEDELKRTKELLEDVEDSLETANGDNDYLRSEIQEYEELNESLVWEMKDFKLWLDESELRLLNNELRLLNRDLISEKDGLKDENDLLKERNERLERKMKA